MKLPRDVSGEELARQLKIFGYVTTRQTGSHMRLTTTQRGEHHVSIPQHRSLKLGTLAGIVGDISKHFEISKADVIERLFAK
jgi:predicted RNA binding protein YcfA (HicA-like mRNA interferase family)